MGNENTILKVNKKALEGLINGEWNLAMVRYDLKVDDAKELKAMSFIPTTNWPRAKGRPIGFGALSFLPMKMGCTSSNKTAPFWQAVPDI